MGWVVCDADWIRRKSKSVVCCPKQTCSCLTDAAISDTLYEDMIRILETSLSTENIPAAARVQRTAPLERIQCPAENQRVWIDICQPTQADIDQLARVFSFHPLTLEDCLHFDERPKLQEFPGTSPYAFIVTHSFSLQEPIPEAGEEGLYVVPSFTEGENPMAPWGIRLNELQTFIGKNYAITVHLHPIEALNRVWERVQQDASAWKQGVDFVYYLVSDEMVDGNSIVLEKLSDQIDEIESYVLDTPSRKTISMVYELRKILARIRRTLSPQRDLMALLARRSGTEIISAETAVYLRDVYDHLVRMNETIEADRDLLSNCVETYLSAVGQRANDIMKQLTLLSSLILPMNFIVGFFGMNFEILPFKSPLVFLVVFVIMFSVIPISMIAWFRHKKWL